MHVIITVNINVNITAKHCLCIFICKRNSSARLQYMCVNGLVAIWLSSPSHFIWGHQPEDAVPHPDDDTSHPPLCVATINIWVKFKTPNNYTLCIIQSQWLLSFFICTKVPNLLVLCLCDYLFITFLYNGTSSQ